VPHGDQKYRNSRTTGYTKRDREHDRAERRRQERARLQELQAHAKKLDAMSAGEREAFLQSERDEQQAQALQAQLLQEQREADELERKESMQEESRLGAGYIISEFASALARRERHELAEGDWLEDPAEAYLTGRGFSEEYTVRTGVKLQINLCLDCSNSMVRNQVEGVSRQVLWTMYLMLRQVERALQPGALRVNVWKFAYTEDGRGCSRMSEVRKSDGADRAFTPEEIDVRVMERINNSGMWGEATYLEPLLADIEKWENSEGDYNAFRLDIILTDGVFEHPKDTRLADVVQHRRDGNLQTVMLNFLPLEDWGDYPVPNRCVQYPADPTNVMALMRMAVGDWINTVL